MSNKRKTGPPQLPPSSRHQKLSPAEAAEEFEWDHDPVSIEILEPSEEAYVEMEELDKTTMNVFFPSPISILTSDSEFLPVQVKSVCLKVNSKSKNKESNKLDGEQKAKQSKRQDSEEIAKQRKNMECEENTNCQKLEAEQKAKQRKNMECEEKTNCQKLEAEQKAKQSRRQESKEKVKRM